MLQFVNGIKKNISNDFLLPNILLIITVFLLPFKSQIISLFIALIAIYTIFAQFNNKLPTSKIRWQTPYFLIFVFFAYIIGVLFSVDQDSGWKEVEYRLSYLIIPLSFLALKRKNIEVNYHNIIKSFLLACFVSSLLSLNKSFECLIIIKENLCLHERYVGPLGQVNCIFLFFKEEFLPCFLTSRIAFKMHTTYLSIYYVVAAFIGFVYLPSTKWKIFSGTYFLIFILLFNSLAIILSMIVMAVLIGVFYLLKNKNIGNVKYYFFFGFIALSLIISVIFKESLFINESYQSFKSDKEAFYEQHKDDPGSIPARIIFWSVTIDLIKQKPWFGYGTGDAKNALVKEYKNRGLDYIASREFNPHNQFLQTTLYLGIIVGLAFLIFFILLLIHAVKTENLLFFVFVFQFFFNLLFESMLEGQAGIIFFSLFLFLLFDKKKKQEILQ